MGVYSHGCLLALFDNTHHDKHTQLVNRELPPFRFQTPDRPSARVGTLWVGPSFCVTGVSHGYLAVPLYLRDREALPSSLYERRRSSAIATPMPTAPIRIAAAAARNEPRLPSSGWLARASASRDNGLVATKLKPKVVGEVAKLVGPDTQIPSKPACSSSAT